MHLPLRQLPLCILFAAMLFFAWSPAARSQNMDPKIWAEDTGIQITVNPGNDVLDGSVITPGSTRGLSISASDSDSWEQRVWYELDPGAEYWASGTSADDMTYTWTCNGGSISSVNSNGDASWIAPTAPGTYTITCTVDDVASYDTDMWGTGTGDRDDDYEEYTIQVQVDGKTWSAGDLPNGLATSSINAWVYPPIQSGHPINPGEAMPFIAQAPADSDNYTYPDPVTAAAEEDTVTYTWSASGGDIQADTNPITATWTAPTAPGTYTITCRIDDVAAIGALDHGSRDDDYVDATYVLVVPKRTWGPDNGLLTATEAAPTITAPANTNGLTAPVHVGETVALEAEAVTDTDSWVQNTLNGSGTDAVSYQWSATNGAGAPAGSFPDGSSGRSLNWIAPATSGTYTLKCVIEDIPTTVEEPDEGTRNDTGWELTQQITVVQLDHLKYFINGMSTDWQDVPQDELYIPVGTEVDFLAQTDHTFPTGKPVWGGTAGVTGEGVIDPAHPDAITFNTPGTYTVTASCGNQKSVSITVIGVSFSRTSAIVKQNQQLTFTATVNPIAALNQITFASLDPDTASIEQTGVQGQTVSFTLQGVDLGTTDVKALLGTGEGAPVLDGFGVWVNRTGLDSNEVIVDPTAGIRKSSEETYAEEVVQSSQVPVPGTAATYYARVRNDNLSEFNTGADSYTVTGPSGANGWTISYFDVANNNADITPEVTGQAGANAWVTTPVAEGGTWEVKVEVTPPVGVTVDTPCVVPVTFTSGRPTAESATATASTMPLIAPQGLVVDPQGQDRKVSLEWTDSDGAEYYRIYRRTGSNGEFVDTDQIAQTGLDAFTDNNRRNNTTYYYIVRAVSHAGDVGPASSVVSDTTDFLPAPANFEAEPGDKQVSLSWDTVSLATNYRIYRATDEDGPFALIGTAQAPDTTFANSALINGLTFYYKVRAWNSGGESADSVISGAVTPTGLPPVAPVGLTATGGDRQVALEWDAVEGTLHYKIYRATSETGTYTVVGQASAQTESPAYIDGYLTNNTSYYYKVTAVDGMAQESDPSNIDDATTDPLDAPTGLGAVAGIREVRLTWNAVERADAYEIYRGTQTGGPYIPLRRVLELEFVDQGLPGDDDYYYIVRAWNSGGTGEDSVEEDAHPAFPIVDAMIATGTDTDFSGYAVYNSDALNQAVAQNTGIGLGAIYSVRVQNQGSAAVQFNVTAPAGSNGWSITYYDGEERDAEHDITDEVTDEGWETPDVNSGAYREITVVVQPDATVADGAQNILLLAATQVGQTANTDTVKATTTRVRQVAGLEYKLTASGDWDEVPADGLWVPKGADVYFRATLNPTGETWPTGKPEWKSDGTSITAPAEMTTPITFADTGRHELTATCDNTLTAIINVVGVAAIEYSEDGSEFAPVPDTGLEVAQDTTVKFRAVPEGGNWPDTQPVWSGETGTTDANDGALRSVTFGMLSTSATDFKTVTATCGTSSLTANVLVVPKVDIGIRNPGEISYGTERAQNVIPNVAPATYLVKIENSTANAQGYILTGTEEATGWTVRYYDDTLTEANRDITAAVIDTPNGSSLTLAANTKRELRIVVTPALSVVEDASLPVTLTVTSAANPQQQDTVTATTTRWRQLDYMEYSTDGGETWETLEVGYDSEHPLTVGPQEVIGLRAVRRHPEAGWPPVPYPQMGYPRWDKAGYGYTGERIWVSWHRDELGARSVSVGCGDSISIYVNVVE